MIYALTRFWSAKKLQTLIVVPTTSLVEQMFKDFKSMVGTQRSIAIKYMQVLILNPTRM